MKYCGLAWGVITMYLQGCSDGNPSTDEQPAEPKDQPKSVNPVAKKVVGKQEAKIDEKLVAQLMEENTEDVDRILKANARLNGQTLDNRPPLKGPPQLNREWFRLNIVKIMLNDVYDRREELQKQHADKQGNMVWMLQLGVLTDMMKEWDALVFDNHLLTDRSAFIVDDPRFKGKQSMADVEHKIMNPESSWDQIYSILSIFPVSATVGSRTLNPALEACMIFIPHIPLGQQLAFVNGLELNVGSGLGSDTDELKFDKAMSADLLKQDIDKAARLSVDIDIDDVVFTRDMVRDVQQRIFAKKYGYWNSPALNFKQKLGNGHIVSADLRSWWGRPDEL